MSKSQAPEKLENLKITPPKEEAGGLPAIKSSLKFAVRAGGIKKAAIALTKVNQFDGFDCPGCAWPDADQSRSIAEFCENGAKAVAEEITRRKATSAFFQFNSIEQLKKLSDYELGRTGRLTQPMVLHEGQKHYQPIEWQEAFDLIGSKLNQLKSPDEAIFYTSGRTSNEAAFLYQLFVRQFGTNNLPDCSNMCHESSGAALSETVGIGKGSVTLEDFNKTELIIIIGQNPGTNHPRMLSALQEAKSHGAKIITINPLKEAGLVGFRHPQHPQDLIGEATPLTDLLLQVRINGDVPLLKAIMKMLLDKENESPGAVFDNEFIKNYTSGFEDFLTDLQKHTLEGLIEATGISQNIIEEAVDIIADKKKIIVCWAMGLTQHKNAVDNIREVVNLLLMKGSIGKSGAGTCPVRGHSNVQGDRTMGIWERLKPSFGKKLREVFNFEPPEKTGYDVVETIAAMKDEKAKVFIGMGGNFLSATPDTELTGQALQQCELTVQISTKLNRGHLVTGKTALILPCLGRTEADYQNGNKQFVTVENSTGVVHQSNGSLTPASKILKSEPAIVVGIAKATLKDKAQDYWEEFLTDYDVIRNYIEKTIPGFEDYNRRVRNPGGFYLPNGAREGKFFTKTDKANFTVNKVPAHQLKNGQLLMMTIRSHDQYNTTIYGLNDRYRGIQNERRVVLMHPDDIEIHGFKKLDEVNIYSYYDDVERVAERFLVIPYDIPRTCIATYFPEANPVIPYNHYAHTSKTPISKSVVVTLKLR